MRRVDLRLLLYAGLLQHRHEHLAEPAACVFGRAPLVMRSTTRSYRSRPVPMAVLTTVRQWTDTCAPSGARRRTKQEVAMGIVRQWICLLRSPRGHQWETVSYGQGRTSTVCGSCGKRRQRGATGPDQRPPMPAQTMRD
jgi:hypothetical protein